jgi:hypothetical protein
MSWSRKRAGRGCGRRGPGVRTVAVVDDPGGDRAAVAVPQNGQDGLVDVVVAGTPGVDGGLLRPPACSPSGTRWPRCARFRAGRRRGRRVSSTCSTPTDASSRRTRGRKLQQSGQAARARIPAMTRPTPTPPQGGHQRGCPSYGQVVRTATPRPPESRARRTPPRHGGARRGRTRCAVGAAPGADLVPGDMRWWRWAHIDDLPALHPAHHRPAQVRAAPTAARLLADMISTSGIVDPGAPGLRPEERREERCPGLLGDPLRLRGKLR